MLEQFNQIRVILALLKDNVKNLLSEREQLIKEINKLKKDVERLTTNSNTESNTSN